MNILRKKRIFLLWISILLLGPFTIRSRSVEELIESPLDLTVMIRFGVLGLILFFVFAEFLRRKTIKKQILQNRALAFLFLYIGIGLISSMISENPIYSFGKTFELLTGVVLVVCIYNSLKTEKDFENWFNTTFLVFCFLLFLTLFWLIFKTELALSPPEGTLIDTSALVRYQLKGLWPTVTPTTLAGIAAMSGIISMGKLAGKSRNKEFLLSLSILSVIFLLLTQSRTSIIAFAFIAPVLLFSVYRRKYIPLVGLIILCSLVVFNFNLIHDFLLRGQHWELFTSFTGRLFFWKEGIEAITPTLGIGYGMGTGTRIVVLRALSPGMSTIHNAWLEALINTGLLGLIFFSLYILISLKNGILSYFKAKYKRDYQVKFATIVALQLLLIFKSITMSDLALFSIDSLLFLQFSVYAFYLLNRLRKDGYRA